MAQQAQPPARAPGPGAAGAAPLQPQTAPVPPSPVGVWIDHTGRGAIAIEPCGPALCGRIVWLKEPNDKRGQPLKDLRNEDRGKRSRPICGLQIIGGVREMRDGTWDKGWIYDPEQGASFDVELRLTGPNVLQVTGYMGVKFLSETYRWRRAEAMPEPVCPAQAPA